MMKRFWLALLIALCGAWPAQAQQQDSAYELTEAARLPPNLRFAGDARSLLEKLWQRSATFRRQCARIAAAPKFTVKLSFNAVATPACRCRALTIVYHKKRLASVRIFRLSDRVELLGHEFEHVLEQLEGLDLPALAAAKDDRVHRTDGGQFETPRAVQSGRQVKAEYERARRHGPVPVEAGND